MGRSKGRTNGKGISEECASPVPGDPSRPADGISLTNAFISQRPLSSHAFDGAERVQLFDVTVLPPSDLNPFLDAKRPGLARFNKCRGAGTLDVQCAHGSQISVGSVKQRNKNQIPAKDWWNGVWASRKEDGFVRLSLVTEGRKVDNARGT